MIMMEMLRTAKAAPIFRQAPLSTKGAIGLGVVIPVLFLWLAAQLRGQFHPPGQKDELEKLSFYALCSAITATVGYAVKFPPRTTGHRAIIFVGVVVVVLATAVCTASQSTICAMFQWQNNIDSHRLYVSVTVPNSKDPIVTDLAPTLKKEGLSMTVDGLKEAVKKKLPEALTGIGIERLIVYAPYAPEKDKGKEYTKMSTPLVDAEEEEPYHIEVK
jgi:hypothetical protein